MLNVTRLRMVSMTVYTAGLVLRRPQPACPSRRPAARPIVPKEENDRAAGIRKAWNTRRPIATHMTNIDGILAGRAAKHHADRPGCDDTLLFRLRVVNVACRS